MNNIMSYIKIGLIISVIVFIAYFMMQAVLYVFGISIIDSYPADPTGFMGGIDAVDWSTIILISIPLLLVVGYAAKYAVSKTTKMSRRTMFKVGIWHTIYRNLAGVVFLGAIIIILLLFGKNPMDVLMNPNSTLFWGIMILLIFGGLIISGWAGKKSIKRYLK